MASGRHRWGISQLPGQLPSLVSLISPVHNQVSAFLLDFPPSPAISIPPLHRGPDPETGIWQGQSAHPPPSGVFWYSGLHGISLWLEDHAFGGTGTIWMDLNASAVQGYYSGFNLQYPLPLQVPEHLLHYSPFILSPPSLIDGLPGTEAGWQAPPLTTILVHVE